MTKITNANQIKFRASSFGNLMTNDRSGKFPGETCIKEMIKIYNYSVHKRREIVNTKFMEKGNEREEDSITLLSRVTKTVYFKNSERLENDFFSGEPDMFLGKDIRNAQETNDTKTSWSLDTFKVCQYECGIGKLNKDYEYQGHVYMALTGAKKHTVSYCLVNGTHKLLSDALRQLSWQMSIIDINNPPDEFIKAAQQIELNHIFDKKHFEEENPGYEFYNTEWDFDIPKEERLAQFSFHRNEEKIKEMEIRVLMCRSWMNKHLFKL